MTPEYQRILLVDDDDVTNFLSREIFRHYHPDVCIDIAQNGKEAIELLLRASEEGEASLPQIILLDINMPVMDGISWTISRQWRKAGQTWVKSVCLF
ncbi:MAG: response regulator [Sediminibacterium magnilacihabitans]|nr:response regulator [Sediminibacterium magnilacihabitans]